MSLKLPVKNFDEFCEPTDFQQKKKHGPLLPNNLRCLLTGASGCGKTNCLFSLIFHTNGLRFENIYIICKTLHQPKYKFLEQVLTDIKGIGFHKYTDTTNELLPEDVLPNSIVIFDDVSTESQKNIKNFFAYGRHCNIDIFYLAQTYSKIQKQLMRDNANFLIVFRQDDLNLRHIYNDHISSSNLPFDKFKQICTDIWNKDKYTFICIDKEELSSSKLLRSGFDNFITDIF